MAYIPLARKYRPARFEELVGQDHTARAIGNAIELKREPHAVIFSGVRGVGKTTLARLYAKALNCESGPTAKPCNTCPSCVAITSGNHEDVLEIDGASNTSVDDVRILRETVGYVPQRSSFRIYIIDEVHMLSHSAFNALLKTLEEPPQHVVFVFATTEFHKIPQTIVSRCQTFFLRKITTHMIAERIAKILTAEGIEFEPRAALILAREGRGSMRDALTALDQAIALGGGKVSAALITEFLCHAGVEEYVAPLYRSVLMGQTDQALQIIEAAYQRGIEFVDLVDGVCEYGRNAIIIRNLKPEAYASASMALSDSELNDLQNLCSTLTAEQVSNSFRHWIQCRKDLDGSHVDRFIVENYACEWILAQGQGVQREKPKAAMPASTPQQAAPAPVPESVSTPTPIEDLKFPESWRELVERWKQIKPLQARIFEDTLATQFSDQYICIAVNEQTLAGKRLLNKDVLIKIKDELSALFSFSGRLEIVKREEPKVAAASAPDTILDSKRKEKEDVRENLIREAQRSPLTQRMLEVFGGRIEDATLDP